MTQHATAAFRAARDLLLAHREDYASAYAEFSWPRPEFFNWALDWFDVIAEGNHRPALHVVREGDDPVLFSFAEMAERSNRVANWLRSVGVVAGDRVLVRLGNQVELWETLLAAMKLRAVVIPAAVPLGPADLSDRIHRGRVRHVITRAEGADDFATVAGDYTRVAVGAHRSGWLRYADAHRESADFRPDGPTRADDPLTLYFTSGTTSLPKVVEHTHVSYPIGHLATMYWVGLRPGDVHLNISSPGWAKHAWSSLFAPWNAEATVLAYQYDRFDPDRLIDEMNRAEVTTFCAPPTVWRMLLQADLGRLRAVPREAVSAGEPLNPEVIDAVRRSWGVTVRDGFGQTESVVQVANPPGEPVRPGAVGWPMPGFTVTLLDPVSGAPGAAEGEISLDLSTAPVGLMAGYHGDDAATATVTAGGFYRTGDLGAWDADGRLTYVSRTDDVFKASDYRISPFELESVLLEHEAVAEAAVVPAPDPVRLAVPKAYVVLADGWEPGPETARTLFAYTRSAVAGYKRIRRLEFGALPKTISGKIRRVELREATAAGSAQEYREEDLR